MPFALDLGDALSLADRIDGVIAAEDIPLPPGRGPWGNNLLRRLSHHISWRPSITLLRFALQP